MVNLENNFNETEKRILLKLYEYYLNEGEIANIEGWIDDLNLTPLAFRQIVADMFKKKLLRYYYDTGDWSGIQAGISLEGMKRIGKKPVDFNNQVKECKFVNEEDKSYILVAFYNKREEKYYLDVEELRELKVFAMEEGFIGFTPIYDWLKKNRLDIFEVVYKYNNSHVIIPALIDALKGQDINSPIVSVLRNIR